MARYDHTPIFQTTYILTVNVYKAAGNFKKEYKYTLGEKLKLICHDLLNLTVMANSQKEKGETLRELDYKLETLRIHLRLAYDLQAVGAGLLGEFNRQIEEIGRQLGGWQKWMAKSNQ